MTYAEMKAKVREYMLHTEQPVDIGEPSPMRRALIQEELMELLKEMADLAYVMLGSDVESMDDWHRGMVYDLINTCEDMALDFPRAFELVHQNNMNRSTQDDGTILRREDGKIIKNPNTPKVDLKSCLL